MARSRLAWAGSTFAPWGIALGFLVSITAQAGQDAVGGGSLVAQNAPFDRASPVRQALLSSTYGQRVLEGEENPIREARLTLGGRDDLAAISDEIEPNAAVKQGASNFPAIDRTGKSDPFVVLRPGFDAHWRPPVPSGQQRAENGTPDAPAAIAPPSGAEVAAARPQPEFGDGATPGVPLELALNSATPTPSDGKAIAAAAQTTVAARSEAFGRPNYAALIDPKDSARQMRCLAEAVYFESRSEPEEGQAAVAQVVLNRVRSGIFPTDVCSVVYQDRSHPFACQFSFACEGKSLRIEEPGAWAVATRIAGEVVSGANFNPKVAEALNYHANYVYPFWAPSLRRVDRIGAHIFYAMRAGLNWAPGALNGRGDLPPAPTVVASATPVGAAR